MKYIIQLFQNHDYMVDTDSYCMFQVIFTAKSKKEAKKKSASILRKWKKEQQETLFGNNFERVTYTQQTLPLVDFINIKEKQYKVCFT